MQSAAGWRQVCACAPAGGGAGADAASADSAIGKTWVEEVMMIKWSQVVVVMCCLM